MILFMLIRAYKTLSHGNDPSPVQDLPGFRRGLDYVFIPRGMPGARGGH
jgi:hypothetical protein